MEADFMDLIHWDVGFALKKMKEQIENKQYRRIVISADRELFPIAGLRSYLERTPIANLARVQDIYNKARTIVDLHNFDFKWLENGITYETSYSFLLPGGGFLQINNAMECIEIRKRDIFNTIPSKDNYDHFFEAHPTFVIYSSQEFAKACSGILNVLSAFYPVVTTTSAKNKMTNEEKFLCLLYLKTKNDPQRGFDSAVLAKLIGLQATNLRLLLFQLSAGEYLNTRQGFGNNLVIGTNGIQLARSLVVPGRVTILRFLSAKYLSPTNVAKHSVIFYYYVIVPDQSEANHSITVSATDIVANTWGKSYAAGQPGEQLLLLHGRDHIAQKLLRGDLQQHEDVEIRMQDLHHLPHYTLDDLVPVGEAEFLVEHPQPVASPSPIVASGDTAEILGNRIVRTKTTINVLFKAKYNEELFLQSELQNVLDLHKEATTEDAFYNRVISLGTTVGDLNLTILRKLSNSDNQPRSISLLSDFVQSLTPNVSDIIKPMRNITTLRNAYPAHKDKKETIDAYRGLGITPPVVHYSESWKLILAAYCKALESLRDLFLQKLGQQTP